MKKVRISARSWFIEEGEAVVEEVKAELAGEGDEECLYLCRVIRVEWFCLCRVPFVGDGGDFFFIGCE